MNHPCQLFRFVEGSKTKSVFFPLFLLVPYIKPNENISKMETFWCFIQNIRLSGGSKPASINYSILVILRWIKNWPHMATFPIACPTRVMHLVSQNFGTNLGAVSKYKLFGSN